MSSSSTKYRRKAQINILQAKLDQVALQRNDLHGAIDDYVKKVTDSAKATVEIDNQELCVMREMNAKVDFVLESLMTMRVEIEESVTKYSGIQEPQSGPSASSPACSGSNGASYSADMPRKYRRLALFGRAQTPSHTEVTQNTSGQGQNTTNLEVQHRRFGEGLQGGETAKGVTCHTLHLSDLERRLRELEAGRASDATRLDILMQETDALKNQCRKRQSTSVLDKHERQLKTVSEQCISLHEQLKDFHRLKKTTDQLVISISTLAKKTEVNNLLGLTKRTEESLQKLSSKVDATVLSVKTISRRLTLTEKDERRGLERGFSMAEGKRVDLDDYMKKLAEIDITLTSVKKQVNALSAEKLHWESKAPVGFTAALPTVVERGHVKDFLGVLCNEGKCFDPATGVFTVPWGGLCVTTVTLRQIGQGWVDVSVVHLKSGSGTSSESDEAPVCKAATSVNMTSCTSTGVASVKMGDKVLISVVSVHGDVVLSACSSFSCVLIY